MKIPLSFQFRNLFFQKTGRLYTILDLTSAFPDGRITQHKRFFGKSLTGTFLNYLYTHFAYGNQIDFALSSFNGSQSNQTSKDNAALQGNTYNVLLGINVGVGNVLGGIQFGTGTTPVTAQDYTMQTMITHGVGAGQFSYQQQGASQAVVVVGLTTNFVLQRIAVNNSGNSITVNEIGLSKATAPDYWLLFHEIVAGGQLVLTTQTLTAQITFQVTT